MSTSVEAETGGVKILWLLVHACSYQHNRAHQLLVSGNTRQTARGDGKPTAILRVGPFAEIEKAANCTAGTWRENDRSGPRVILSMTTIEQPVGV